MFRLVTTRTGFSASQLCRRLTHNTTVVHDPVAPAAAAAAAATTQQAQAIIAPVDAAAQGHTATAHTADRRLFVNNLSWQTTEADVRREFGRFGRLSSVMYVPDKHSLKAAAFIAFELAEHAEQARHALHNKELQGRRVTVHPAVHPAH